MATISKVRLLRCEIFHTVFSPLISSCSACGLGPRAAAPEARQPRKAERPRRRWMRNATMAVASDEGFGGEALLRQWDRCEEMDETLMVQVISDALPFCGRCFAKNIWH